MTHRDGFPRFSARSVRRGDAGHREAGAALPTIWHGPKSESLGKPPFRSPMRPVGERRKVLTMPRIAGNFPPTRRAAWAIPMGHYHCSLVSEQSGLIRRIGFRSVRE